MNTPNLPLISRTLRAAFGEDAHTTQVEVSRSEDAARAPFMTGLRVFRQDGSELSVTPATALTYENGRHHGLDAGIYDDAGDAVVRFDNDQGDYTVIDDDLPARINAEIFGSTEADPYTEINDWLCSGPGLVRSGTWVDLRLSEPAEAARVRQAAEAVLTAALPAPGSGTDATVPDLLSALVRHLSVTDLLLLKAQLPLAPDRH